MDRKTFDAMIVAFKGRVPFRPFRVVMTNRHWHDVDEPDALAVRDGMAVFVARGGIPVIFDHEGVAEVIGGSTGRQRSIGDDD